MRASNIGIGTTSPYAMLSVAGQTVAQYFTATSTIAASTFPFASSTALSTGNLTIANSGRIGSVNAPNALTVDSSGNVGIGTTSPYRLLSVAGSGVFAGGDVLASTLTATSTITGSANLVLNGTTGTTTIAAGQGFTIGGSQFVVQQGSGRVGIGTASPNEKMEVGNLTNASDLYLKISNGNQDLYNTGIKFRTTTDFCGFTIQSEVEQPNVSARLNFLAHNNSTGVSAMVIERNTGNIGIGTTTPYARLTVWGPDSAASTTAFLVANSASTTLFAVYDNGNSTYSGTIFQSSDQRLKTDIQTLDSSSSLAAVMQLNPVSYTRLDQPGTGENLGFIAQDVAGLFPSLVSTTSPTKLTPGGTLTLNYTGLIAPMVAAIKEIGTISGAFRQSLVAWLGNSANGINDLFAKTIYGDTIYVAREFCISDGPGDLAPLCLTKAQFAAMLRATGQTPTTTAAPQTTPTATTTATTTTAAGQGSAATTTSATTTPALDTTTDATSTPAASAPTTATSDQEITASTGTAPQPSADPTGQGSTAPTDTGTSTTASSETIPTDSTSATTSAP